jgi:uncharacterized protein (TIGR03435 family)
MIPHSQSVTWSAVASGLGNHLWQSTVVMFIAGLITLALRRNQARTRYCLWMAVSAKFFVPFSLLVGIGTHVAWPHKQATSRTTAYVVMEQASLPFSEPIVTQLPTTLAPEGGSLEPVIRERARVLHALPEVLTVTWLIGLLVVLARWRIRWRRVAAAVREGESLRTGREVEILRRLEQIEIRGIRRPIEIILTRGSIEPGIFGLVRPVLMWPRGISERLDDAHVEAVLAHEVWHVRQGDNLTAAIHMLVEAAFWFYPMVWWLGRRLAEERERSCDEEVVSLYSRPDVYAESILKVCEFCVEAPLTCVSGVTSSDLKKRIVYIMTERVGRKLNLTRKLLLATAGLMAVAVPVVAGALGAPLTLPQLPTAIGAIAAVNKVATSVDAGQPMIAATTKPMDNPQSSPVQRTSSSPRRPDLARTSKEATWDIPSPSKSMAADADPSFETTVITPSNFGVSGGNIRVEGGSNLTVHNESLASLIGFAYGIDARQVVNGPNWVGTDKYDIAAVPKIKASPSLEQFRNMLQKTLADRFKLSFHHDIQELPVYALKVGIEGTKNLAENTSGGMLPAVFWRRNPAGLTLSGKNATMADFAEGMRGAVDRPVLDETGLAGRFDFLLNWPPDASQVGGHVQTVSTDRNAPPNLPTALQEQLGLRLESVKISVDVLVVDHAEKPRTN